ncbi:MAG TPA: hypothetical protein VIR33_13470 [Thermopolyspora sp.]|jgi:hypothetical protein
MRHVFGFVIGAVVTIAVVFGAGWATQDAVQGAVKLVAPVDDGRVLAAIGVMALIGLIIGLVLVGRISPLATFVPSMVLLAWTVVYALDVTRAMSLAPVGPAVQRDLAQAGRGMETLLSSGVFAMLGVALFLPVFMPSRWASRRGDDAGFEETPDQSYY